MAGRTRALTEIDVAEWARYARRIIPLAGAATRPTAVSATPAENLARNAPNIAGHGLRSAAAVAPQTPRLDVGAQPPGVDAASWQRFRRGQLAGARKLDLHGMTAQEALHALRAFMSAAQRDGLRCVEIVTGRGNGERGGVLRREFALWLNLPDIRPMVLAAVHPHTSSAMHSNLANPGSVRLLLRRSRA